MSLQGGYLLFPTTLPGTARHTVPDAERVGGQVRAEHHIVPMRRMPVRLAIPCYVL
jgi:hypothetical protein